jgi:hypothetical protein
MIISIMEPRSRWRVHLRLIGVPGKPAALFRQILILVEGDLPEQTLINFSIKVRVSTPLYHFLISKAVTVILYSSQLKWA